MNTRYHLSALFFGQIHSPSGVLYQFAYFFAGATLAGALTALLFFPTAAAFGAKAETRVEAQTANSKTKRTDTRFIIIIIIVVWCDVLRRP
jgi:hypothetical protein